MFDWRSFEAALLEAILAVARGPYVAVGLSDLYAETDGIICAPGLGLNTDGQDLDSPPDWEFYLDDWAPAPWIEGLTAHACSGTVADWEAAFLRYQDLLADVCRAAGDSLGIPVYYLDYDRFEELLERSLTAAQLGELFPEVGRARAERARVTALPLAQRVAYHIEASDDAALKTMGSAAVPSLLALLREPERASWAAKLLAEIGDASSEVIDALTGAAERSTPDSTHQLWSCRALARLGHLERVMQRSSTLSGEAVATAVAAPYSPFRDYSIDPPPLDYRPLEDLLARRPELAEAIAEEMRPGRGHCSIRPEEIAEALRGTGSTHPIVRMHAVQALGRRRLGEPAGERIIPVLREVNRSDPDERVRRLAGLSLGKWKAR